ncbi:MAG TPA: peptide chain release factor N(5)-glutamine methyltransferase [Nitrospiria bacterium]|nr:peptide chain release factor N(5)-glutamine methyltransferase [Nitrospiria bacterium]
MSHSVEKSETISSLIRRGEKMIESGGRSESPRLEAEILLASVTNGSRLDLYVRFDGSPPAELAERFLDLAGKRGTGVPLQYLSGEERFFNRLFKVGPGVLIPRPETEIVVRQALPFLSEGPFLDIGTGSGCIAVSLLKEGPVELRGTAVDLSEEALRYAEVNVKRHGVEGRLRLLSGDLFSPLPKREKGSFELIVSNPPYLDWERGEMEDSVREFEPRAALDGGAGGTSFYIRILQEAGEWLLPGGGLVLELGAGQIGAFREMLPEFPGWKLLSVTRDEQEIERVAALAWKPEHVHG